VFDRAVAGEVLSAFPHVAKKFSDDLAPFLQDARTVLSYSSSLVDFLKRWLCRAATGRCTRRASIDRGPGPELFERPCQDRYRRYPPPFFFVGRGRRSRSL